MPLDTLGTVLRSAQVPTWLLKNFCLLRGPSGIGDLDRKSRFKVLPRGFKCLWILWKRSYSLFKSPPGYSKTFWLLTGPSEIGDPDRKSRFKVLPRGFKCLWILWGTVVQSFQVPTWLLKNFLVADRSIGNRIRLPQIKVQSITSSERTGAVMFGARNLKRNCKRIA